MKLLELFKGTGSVGKVAEKLGFDIVSLDNNPSSKADITADILEWNYKKFYKDTGFKPDFIWASPPCNTYSRLAFVFKERDTKTAEPLSAKARIGTAILYKTLEIIIFFKSLNPNLKYVIENPRGMMRLDTYMKTLPRYTTFYQLYGDKRRKETDFWSNIQLHLKEGKPPLKTSVSVENLHGKDNCERYKIPADLIKQIFDDYFESIN
jgi:site-specific DNA-cytosine methylase